MTSMSASWFVSYLYHIRIDRKHLNWKIKETPTRHSAVARSERKSTLNGMPMHRHYIEQICAMSAGNLSKNHIGLTGERVLAMARELLALAPPRR